jgi:hypothetical protein
VSWSCSTSPSSTSSLTSSLSKSPSSSSYWFFKQLHMFQFCLFESASMLPGPLKGMPAAPKPKPLLSKGWPAWSRPRNLHLGSSGMLMGMGYDCHCYCWDPCHCWRCMMIYIYIYHFPINKLTLLCLSRCLTIVAGIFPTWSF